MSQKIIGVECDDRIEWHIVNVAGTDYATLCGLDGNDPVVGQTGTHDAPRGTKIDCQHCKSIWEGLQALRLRSTDFA